MHLARFVGGPMDGKLTPYSREPPLRIQFPVIDPSATFYWSEESSAISESVPFRYVTYKLGCTWPLEDYVYFCEDRPQMLNTQRGPQGGYLVNEPAKPRRMAVMEVSYDLWYAVVGFLPSNGNEYEHNLAGELLKLPAGCSVEGVSHDALFDRDGVKMQLECPDFREVLEGGALPQVEATYRQTEDLLGKKVCHFAGWWGDAALVDGYKPPDPPSSGRCSEELGHFTDGIATCYCERLVLMNGKWVETMPFNGCPMPVEEPKKKLHLLSTEESEKLEQPRQCGMPVGHVPRPDGKKCVCGALEFGEPDLTGRVEVSLPKRSSRGYEFL